MDKDSLFQKKRTIRIGDRIFSFEVPKVMGILNVTPDSFYDGGQYNTIDALKNRIQQLVDEGTDIIDIGGYSSRPGAKDISVEEEINRLLPALDLIHQLAPERIISVDTFRAEVLRKIQEVSKVHLLNDISGGLLQPEILQVAAEHKMPVVLMHMPGTPQNMQQKTGYQFLLKDIMLQLAQQAQKAIDCGVRDIIIDPGIGFGKTLEQNFEIINHLESFKILEYPLMIGLSRKSLIYKLLDTSPNKALNGTTALHMASLMKGADILRVHDVREAKETIQLFMAMQGIHQ